MALEGNGANTHVNLLGNFNIFATNNGTFCGWFRFHDDAATHRMCGLADTLGPAKGCLGFNAAGATSLQFAFHYALAWHSLDTAWPPAVDTLYFLAGSWGAAGMKLYVDDTLEGGNAGWVGKPDNLLAAPNSYFLVHVPASEVNDREIFDLRCYDRALSLAEIQSIYHAQGNDSIINGLLGRWFLDEEPDGTACAGAGVVKDVSGGDHHGTPANNPTYRAAPFKPVRSLVSTGIKTL